MLYVSWSGFIKSLYPDEMSDKIFVIIKKVSVVQFILTFVLPVELLSGYIIYLQSMAGVSAIIMLTTLYKARKNNREGTNLTFIGLVILLATAINDVLYSQYIINTLYLSATGLSLMLMMQTVILARRFSKAYKSVESFSEKLLHLDKLKDEFLANTSHELRTPINGIIGITDSLIDGVAGALPDNAVYNLKLINSSSKRLYSLINDILDFSKRELLTT
jgi:two-component system sensor histidine kinase ChiS